MKSKAERALFALDSSALIALIRDLLDMTRRDLQRAMGDQKKPWEIGKSFDRSAPIGPIHTVAQTGHFTQYFGWRLGGFNID